MSKTQTKTLHGIQAVITWDYHGDPKNPYPHLCSVQGLNGVGLTTFVVNDEQLAKVNITKPFTPVPGVWYSIAEHLPPTPLNDRVIGWDKEDNDWVLYSDVTAARRNFKHWMLIVPPPTE